MRIPFKGSESNTFLSLGGEESSPEYVQLLLSSRQMGFPHLLCGQGISSSFPENVVATKYLLSEDLLPEDKGR